MKKNIRHMNKHPHTTHSLHTRTNAREYTHSTPAASRPAVLLGEMGFFGSTQVVFLGELNFQYVQIVLLGEIGILDPLRLFCLAKFEFSIRSCCFAWRNGNFRSVRLVCLAKWKFSIRSGWIRYRKVTKNVFRIMISWVMFFSKLTPKAVA